MSARFTRCGRLLSGWTRHSHSLSISRFDRLARDRPDGDCGLLPGLEGSAWPVHILRISCHRRNPYGGVAGEGLSEDDPNNKEGPPLPTAGDCAVSGGPFSALFPSALSFGAFAPSDDIPPSIGPSGEDDRRKTCTDTDFDECLFSVCFLGQCHTDLKPTLQVHRPFARDVPRTDRPQTLRPSFSSSVGGVIPPQPL